VANNAHDETTENDIMSDLLAWACKNYQGGSKIDACIAEEIE
jgi:hypothetical protein